MSDWEIASKDISVIVSGPIDVRTTFISLQSVRKWLPDSKLIFSTWKGEFAKARITRAQLPIDVLVEGRDPGGPVINPVSQAQASLFRVVEQFDIAKTHVETPYVLRMRNDLVLRSANFLRLWRSLADFPERRFPVFNKKVMILSQYTRERLPGLKGRWPALLHTSDWFAFGETKDVCEFMTPDLPASMVKYATYLTNMWPKLGPHAPYIFTTFQFPPEMWLGLRGVGDHVGISLSHWLERPVSKELEVRAQNALIDNFIVLPASSVGVESKKYARVTRTFTTDLDYATSAVTGLRYRAITQMHYPGVRGIPKVPTSLHDYWVGCLRLFFPVWKIVLLWKRSRNYGFLFGKV